MKNEIIINGVTYVKKEENKQNKRGDKYWYFCNGWEVEYGYNITDIDKALCYPTESDCIKARDKILALYRIKSYCEEQWGEFIPDWSNIKQWKRSIDYNHDDKKYTKNYDYKFQWLNQLYLAKQEHCVEIIEKFKDDLDILFDIKWKQ